MIEVNTILNLKIKRKNEKKSYFEMVFSTIIKVNDEIKEKKN
jgi:preprotein translocase subunit SecB